MEKNNEKKVFATLIMSPGKENFILEIGDQCFLVPEPENEADKEAVAVFILDGVEEEKIGYLAQSPSTLIKGEFAKKIKSLISEGRISKGVKVSEVTSREVRRTGGEVSTKPAYILEIPFTLREEDVLKEIEEKKKKEDEEFSEELIKITSEKEGIGIDKKIMRKAYKVMQHYKLANSQILEILKSYKKYPKELENNIPKTVETMFIDSSNIMKASTEYALTGSHLRFVGPRATGKNLAVEVLAFILQRPIINFPVSVTTDEFSLIAEETLKAKDGLAVMELQKKSLTIALEHGAILVLDEINSIRPEVATAIHSALDFRREISLSNGEVIKGDKNFIAIATMNEKYEGTREMNEATISRFSAIRFNEYDNIVEILKEKVADALVSDIDICQKIYSAIKDAAFTNGEISDAGLSIRGFESALRVSSRGIISIKDALRSSVIEMYQDEFERESANNILEMYCK